MRKYETNGEEALIDKRGKRKTEDKLTDLEKAERKNAQLNRSENEVWLMPIGKLLDLWACHKQFIGVEKAKKTRTINDIVPLGI